MQLKKLLTIITKLFFSIFVIAYPFIVFYALQQNIAVRFIGLILLITVMFSFANNKNKHLLMAGLTLCLLIIFFNQEIFLKLYPVLMNTVMCAIFALSLRKKPLLAQFAEKMHKKTLAVCEKTYARHATLAWSIFMFINTIISLITVFLSNEIWLLYNGFISYVLIGIMALTEYIVRKGKEKCLTI